MRSIFPRLLAGASVALLCASAAAQSVQFNELYISHAGTDDQEFIELIGAPGTLLDNIMVLVVEGEGASAGILDRAYDLTGLAIPASGYFVLGDTAVANLDLDIATSNSLENGTNTFYLVDATTATPAGIQALLGTHVETGPDTTSLPTTVDAVLDLVSVTDFGTGDLIFDGALTMGPDGSFLPAGIFRAEDAPNNWCNLFLDYDDVANLDQPRTPGTMNGGCAETAWFNEIYISHAGLDDQEFVELIGTPGMFLDDVMVLVVEGEGSNAGTLDRAWDLSGLRIPQSGYFVLGDTAVVPLDYDIGADNRLENGTETFYLVDASTATPLAIEGLLGTHVDTGAGTTSLPGMADTLYDLVAATDLGTGDVIYDGAVSVGPDGTFFPAGIFRGGDYPAAWCDLYLDYDDDINTHLPRTPGAANGLCYPAPTPFCFGDASDGALCPCGNVPVLGSGEGCVNSSGVGALTGVTGSPDVVNDDMVLTLSQASASELAVLVQGTGQFLYPFRDGVYCMSNPTERMEFTTTDATGNTATTISIVTVGQVLPGVTNYYQWYYRDVTGSPCGGGGNFASAVQIDWL